MTEDSAAAVARVRALHQQYLPTHVDFYTCASCNILGGGLMVVPWPCPTIVALDGCPTCGKYDCKKIHSLVR